MWRCGRTVHELRFLAPSGEQQLIQTGFLHPQQVCISPPPGAVSYDAVWGSEQHHRNSEQFGGPLNIWSDCRLVWLATAVWRRIAFLQKLNLFQLFAALPLSKPTTRTQNQWEDWCFCRNTWFCFEWGLKLLRLISLQVYNSWPILCFREHVGILDFCSTKAWTRKSSIKCVISNLI